MENKLSSADVLRIARETCLAPAYYNGSCRYWTDKGDRCAIGQCLPLETAQALRNCTDKASKIFDLIRFAFDETITPEFLDAVQRCHDRAALDLDLEGDGLDPTEDKWSELRKIGSPTNLEWRRVFLAKLDAL